jgi:hypothetical protein
MNMQLFQLGHAALEKVMWEAAADMVLSASIVNVTLSAHPKFSAVAQAAAVMVLAFAGFTRHFSKNSATDYIQFSPNASRRSTVHETESPDDHRFASSFPDAESFDEDPHRLPLISTRSGPLDADASLGSPVLTTGATPKRRETSVPLRLEVLKLHDKIIAEKRSFNGPKSPPL